MIVHQGGAAAACALLEMVERTVSAMQPATAAAHSEALFTFLQRALDVRQRSTAASASASEVRVFLPCPEHLLLHLHTYYNFPLQSSRKPLMCVM